MRVLVITGHSNAGKSTFVRTLAERYALDGVDADHDEDLGGLRQPWDAFLGGDAMKLVEVCASRVRPAVLDWSYANDYSAGIAGRLIAAQVPTWWFDADDTQAHTSFVRRKRGALADYEHQVAWIRSRRPQLRALYGARWIETLSAAGAWLTFDEILNAMRRTDPLPWLL